MSSAIPIILKGNNLGERHRHFNSLVLGAHQQGTCLTLIRDTADASRLDTLFQIELASKHRNVDYILKTLQHEDMLFVSRALKCCTWLLESNYQDVINPEYLEGEVYPYMMTPAVNKMKQWLHVHLKDARRCRQFYQYYSCHYHIKIKFLKHCAPDFIEGELLNIMERVTPKQLKVICEYCPRAIKLYYDNLSKNPQAYTAFFKKEKEYFECTQYILHSESASYFEILEKYYNYESLGSLSPTITKCIVKRHKQRVLHKPELYAAWLLDKTTLAKHLRANENKHIVLRLARAEYLNNYFSYKFVEPFIKRLKFDERAAFKKKVFIDKNVGNKVAKNPYPKFLWPELEDTATIFDDKERDPEDFKFFEIKKYTRRIKKRKGNQVQSSVMYSDCCKMDTYRIRTPLDQLFDRYRFFNFERTMFELRKKVAAESSVQNRQFMMLVLVSKCGDNMEHVGKLVRFLVDRHHNESSNLRAAVVRSLVKRARTWRLPAAPWRLLLFFGRDLGLDGASPLICKEGMHALVLRTLLLGKECVSCLREAFLNNFSSLTEYKLNAVEKRIIGVRLPALLLQAATADSGSGLDRFQLLLDVLSSLNKKLSKCPGVVEALTEAVRCHPSTAEGLLRRMYEERVARRELLCENFALFQTNESYVNVLRHDALLLKSTKEFEDCLKKRSCNYDGFLRKLALYFGEDGGLAATYIAAIVRVMESEPHVELARPLAMLRADLRPIISEYMKEPKGSIKRRLASALQANFHLSGVVDLEATPWRALGAKAVANRLLSCKAVDVDKYIARSLEWRRTLKIALLLAERCGRAAEVYKIVVGERAGATLRAALSYLKRNESDDLKAAVWRAVSPALGSLDLTGEPRSFLCHELQNADYVPANIQAEYWVAVFGALQKVSQKKTLPVLCRLENMLSEVNSDLVKKVIEDFLGEFKSVRNVSSYNWHFLTWTLMKVRIVGKYLLLGEGEEQAARMDDVWAPFRDCLTVLLRRDAKDSSQYLDEFVTSLKYNRAFFDPRLSCWPVLERIVADLRTFLPMEENFKTFVLLHATMLYYKSIQYCVEQFPEKFENVRSKQIEGATAVGKHFGKYVGKELGQLVSRYFDSITILYQKNLTIFFKDQFPLNESRNKFVSAFIGGLLETGEVEALLLAEYLLDEEGANISEPERMDLVNVLKSSQNDEVKFFLHGFLFSGKADKVCFTCR
ncbi:hypothetical protein RR46_03101 [Papilio xuthus]|uniref:Uncharacterized protein n=1 Tax=Papilio xuthus TaxID=66420 RepID=A0A194Q8B4_PAPXU|nr:hypothetical protein RR46_03101 [Papilio xuthus]